MPPKWSNPAALQRGTGLGMKTCVAAAFIPELSTQIPAPQRSRLTSPSRLRRRIDIARAAGPLRREAILICRRLLPGGAVQSREYVLVDPLGADRHPRSIKIHLAINPWSDLATGTRGGGRPHPWAMAIHRRLRIPLSANQGVRR
jgi:hypothetical protein